MSWPCGYINERCDHEECAPDGLAANYPEEPIQTTEDYCSAQGHAFYGWEWNPEQVPAKILPTLGRCYCGAVRYPYLGDPS